MASRIDPFPRCFGRGADQSMIVGCSLSGRDSDDAKRTLHGVRLERGVNRVQVGVMAVRDGVFTRSDGATVSFWR